MGNEEYGGCNGNRGCVGGGGYTGVNYIKSYQDEIKFRRNQSLKTEALG